MSEEFQGVVYADQLLPRVLDALQQEIFKRMVDKGFWERHPEYSESKEAEKIALIHSEVSELLEAVRQNEHWARLIPETQSEHIPDFTKAEEEIADIIIRCLDFSGYAKLRIGEAVIAKMEYNANRPFKHNKRF